MSRLFQLSEATAAQRRFPVYLVDETDGLTPETGESAGQPQVSKNGGAFANTSATLTAIANGAYYVELTAGELDTLGTLIIRFKSAATAEFNMDGQVVAYDPYDAVRMGQTALPNAAAEAANGLYTRGTGAGQINQDANGRIDVNIEAIDTGNVPAPAITGIPDVNVTHWEDDAVVATVTPGIPRIDLLRWGNVFPGALSNGNVQVDVEEWNQGGVNPLSAGKDLNVNVVEWLAATPNALISGQVDSAVGFKKNTAVADFAFLMVDDTDHVTGKTGLTFAAANFQRSIDGGAFANSTNTAVEVANGVYKVALSAADLNGDIIVLKATGTAADDRIIVIKTEA